ncbi:MAG: extracellular solute-binding protein [Chloroflexota bacterium]
MKHKMFLLVLSLVILAIVLPVSAQDDGITVWITGSDTDATTLQAAAAAFTEDTGVNVTVEAVSWDDAYSRYLTAVNSGTGADVFAGGMSWGISLGGVGGLVDLSQQFPDEYQSVLDGTNPSFVEAIIGQDGAVYGVPYNQDVLLMYYLPENLAAVGYDAPPATWEEFSDLVTKLNDAGMGGAGMGWGNVSWLGFQPFLAQAGGSWYTEDCSAAAVNSDAGVTALEYYTTLYEDLGFPQEAAAVSGFSTGDLSILFDGEWVAPGIDTSYPELVGKWAVAPMPVGPAGNNDTFIGGKMMGIFSFSPNVDSAWQFIQWLQTEDAAQSLTVENYNNASLFVPPQTANAGTIQGDPAVVAAIGTQLENTSGPANCPGWEESNADVNLALQSVLFEGETFEEALAQMEDVMNANLVEYGS